MKNRMSEWEVQRSANNLDRISDYCNSSNGMNYLDPSQLSGHLSEWEIQRIANNLDRIEDYRGSGRTLEQNLVALALYLIFFTFLFFVILYYTDPLLLIPFSIVLFVVVALVIAVKLKK